MLRLILRIWLPVLIALNATIKTTRREISGDDFFSLAKDKTTVLEDDEIVTGITIPKPRNRTKGVFIYFKFAIRKSIDFPIVNCAVAIESEEGKVESTRICLNSVYTIPYRATLAEEFLAGKPINNANAEKAAEAAVASACAVNDSKYKVQIAKTLVKRAIMACK